MKAKNYTFKIALSLVIILGVFFLADSVSAHIPRLVFKSSSSEIKPFLIENPDISQAYYAEFKSDASEYYKFSLPTIQTVYLSLLVPDNQNAATGTSLMVIKLNSPDSMPAFVLDGKNYAWKKYYEEYAGDNYYQGPSQSKLFTAGEYLITVSSTNNTGKYVLVTGQKESFPLNEMLKTLSALPSLKMVFFETTFLTIFSGVIGKFLLFGTIALLITVILIAVLILKLKHRRHSRFKQEKA